MPLQIPTVQVGLEQSIQQAMKNAGRGAQINLGTNSRQINALAQPLGRITGQADEFTKSMEAANARVFAFGASVGIINGVSKAFGALVKNTIEVEKSLTDINTVLNASTKELDQFGNKLFQVAKNTGQSFDVVAKGALELARQGLGTEETLKRINDALILSRLSGLDATQSVEGLTAAFNSFKDSGATTSDILNKLVVVSQKFAVSERDLIEALKRSASVADQAGVSLDELIGIVTAVQERTARGGAVIGNAFKTIFSRIQDKGALQDLQDLGIQVTDTAGKILPATTILQNLAKQFTSLSQVEQADLAKKLGGVYQLSNLLAAVKDLSSEQSKYAEAVRLSSTATDQAYKKNAALNETLASLINKVSVSAQQLGATLGQIGITDSAKNLLGFFNGLLESIQKILGEESAMGTFVRGLVKGIGNLISGPGLALFAAIIAKLSKDLIQFGFASLKSFFGIGKAAKEIESVEKSIANALSTNINLQRQLFALEGNRAAQIKLMTEAVVQQEAAMRRMTSTAGALAGPLYQQGVRSVAGQGLRVPKAAGGYMPAVAGEASDIRRGVGGAKSGDRPVVIPNFAFGGGKKGTMVANTGEYIVPNFAGGGSAIFNRNMVRSMGMPAGAKKINAAGGFVPNFATTQDDEIAIQNRIAEMKADKQSNFSPKKLMEKIERPTISDIEREAAKRLLLEKQQSKQEKAEARTEIDAKGYAMLIPSPLNLSQTESKFNGDFGPKGNKTYFTLNNLKTYSPKIPSGVEKASHPEDKFLEENIINSMANAGASFSNLLRMGMGQDPNVTKNDLLNSLEKTSGAKGAIGAAVGAAFESAVNLAVKSSNISEKEIRQRNKIGGDFDFRSASDDLKTLFGFKESIGDYKSSNSQGNKESFASKIWKEKGGNKALASAAKSLSQATKNAANGYIPNFAGPNQGGKINISQIAKGLGLGLVKVLIDQYLGDGVVDSLEASGLTSLRPADAKILMTELQKPVKGKHKRAFERALMSDPQMQKKFPDYYKRLMSRSGNAAGGFLPNFADPLKAAIGREMAAGVPASQIYVDKNPSLKNALNPMGLMVANRRDEPAGGMQGINRARREGMNPQMYGAANGFIPNYAPASGSGNDPNTPKQSRDFLGTIFAVQSAMSVLTGATEGATSGLGKFTNSLGNIASNASTFLFLGQGLKALVPETSKLSGVFGKLGIAGAVGVGVITGLNELAKYLDSTNPAINKAKSGMESVADAASKAAVNLNNLSPTERQSIEKRRSDLISGARLSVQAQNSNAFDPKKGFLGNLKGAFNTVFTSPEENKKNIRASFEGASKDLENTLNASVDQALAVGVSYDKMWNMISEASKSGGEITAAEVSNITSEIEGLVKSIAQIKPDFLIKKFKLNTKSGLGASLIRMSDKQIENTDAFAEIRKEYVKGGIIEPKAQAKNFKVLRDQLIQTKESEESEKIQQIDQIRVDLAQSQLKFELERVVANQRLLDNLDKQLMSSEILNNLSEKEKRDLQYKIELRNKDRELTDGTVGILQEQVTKIKGIVGDSDKLNAVKDKINKASQEQLQSQEFILEITRQMQGLAGDDEKLQQSISEYITEQLRQLKLKNASERESIKNGNELKEQDYDRLQILKDSVSAAERLSKNKLFAAEFSAKGSQNQRELQINYLENQLSRTPSQQGQLQLRRQIDQLKIQNAQEERNLVPQRALQEAQTRAASLLPEQSVLREGIFKAQNLDRVSEILRSAGNNYPELKGATEKLIEEIKQNEQSLNQSSDQTLLLAQQQAKLNDQTSYVTTSYDKLIALTEQAPQNIQDLLYERATTTSGKRLKEIDFELQTQEGLAGMQNASEAEIAAYLKSRSVKQMKNLFNEEFFKTAEENAMEFNKSIVDASVQFKNNLIDGLSTAIAEGQKFSDILRNATLDFAKNITRVSMNNLFNSVTGTLFKASGGPISGGSGTKDDVPAMLMGGEYVINKKAVQKYGMGFLNALNSGSLGGYAAGGAVTKDLFTPGTFGQEGIVGNDLLRFASQSYTGGMNDVIMGGGAAAISLEPESMRLTNFGRRFGSQAESTRAAKEQALGLYIQEYEAGQEARRKKKADKKAFKKQLATMAIMAVASMGLNAAGQGFKSGFGASKAANGTFLQNVGAGAKGIFNSKVGGLNNLFTGFGGIFKGDFSKLKLSQGIAPKSPVVNGGGLDITPLEQEELMKDSFYRQLFNKNQLSVFDSQDPSSWRPRATGGMIPNSSGVDTISAMLSGGEFVMNRAAAQNIGAGNLQSLNAGSSSLMTEEASEELNNKLISKLDELIEATGSGAGNITINVDAATGSATQTADGSSTEDRQQLARQIKDVVLKVIQDEKRIGGQLRRGM